METKEAPSSVASMVNRLNRWPLFREVSQEALEAWCAAISVRQYTSGQTIFLAGDPCERLYLVDQGFVILYHLSPEGREYILDYIGPGRALNLAAALDGRPEITSARAVDEARLLVLSRHEMMHLFQRHGDLALAAARQLARETRRLSEIASGLALDPVRKRLAAFLLEQAEHAPSPEHWTQERIAAHIGTVRDVVGRVLREFAAMGLIRRERGQLVILDRERLKQEAEG